MRKTMIGRLTVICFAALMQTGCASDIIQHKVAETMLIAPGDITASAAFQKLVKTRPGTADYERSRIEYLIEQLSQSGYTFIRNGENYSAKRAAIHIKWKYFRYCKNMATAEQFVKTCASGSNASGEKYLLKKGEAEYYYLEDVFSNELVSLDKEYIRYQDNLKEELIRLQREKQELAAADLAKKETASPETPTPAIEKTEQTQKTI